MKTSIQPTSTTKSTDLSSSNSLAVSNDFEEKEEQFLVGESNWKQHSNGRQAIQFKVSSGEIDLQNTAKKMQFSRNRERAISPKKKHLISSLPIVSSNSPNKLKQPFKVSAGQNGKAETPSLQRKQNNLPPFPLGITNTTNRLIQRDGQSSERPTAEFFNLPDLVDCRAQMELRFQRVSSYISLGTSAGDTVRNKLLTLSNQYRTAYQNYEQVIHAARQEARNQEFWMNICIGIGAGVLMSVGAAFILPSSAAAAFTLTANEAAVAAASGLGQAGAGAILGSGLASSISISGTDLQPGGLDPNVLNMQIWQNVALLYRKTLEMNPVCRNLHMLSNGCEYLIGEIRAHIAGGEVQMSQDEVLDMVETLLRANNSLRRQDNAISQSLQALQTLQQSATRLQPSLYPSSEMEKHIWILWMAELDDPSILDLDAIEDHLNAIGVIGPGSVLGVDFGMWTSGEDELEARSAARREARALRSRISSLSELPH